MILKASRLIRTVVYTCTSVVLFKIEMKTIRVSFFRTETHECVMVMKTNKQHPIVVYIQYGSISHGGESDKKLLVRPIVLERVDSVAMP
jgi:hypothetical protein